MQRLQGQQNKEQTIMHRSTAHPVQYTLYASRIYCRKALLLSGAGPGNKPQETLRVFVCLFVCFLVVCERSSLLTIAG